MTPNAQGAGESFTLPSGAPCRSNTSTRSSLVSTTIRSALILTDCAVAPSGSVTCAGRAKGAAFCGPQADDKQRNHRYETDNHRAGQHRHKRFKKFEFRQRRGILRGLIGPIGRQYVGH